MKNGGQGRNRTTDTRIFSPLLYQLSYLAKFSEIAMRAEALGERGIRPTTAPTVKGKIGPGDA